MIQRKQTLFILLAIILSITCLSLPIGIFEPQTMGDNATLFNLAIIDGNGSYKVGTSMLLFVLLLITCPIGLYTIFKYKNRKLQMSLCVLNIILILLWYGVFYLTGYVMGYEKMDFHPKFASCLPLAIMVFYIMARQGIKADERLVRSADRIR